MPITFCSFNVRDLFEPRYDAERIVYPSKVANIAKLLDEANADVIALQEVSSARVVREVLRAMANGEAYGHVVAGPSDARGICNALVSRMPVVASRIRAGETLPLPSFRVGDPAPYEGQGRLTLRRAVVHFQVDGGPSGLVNVIACHLKSKLPTAQVGATGAPILPTTGRGRAEGEVRSLLLRSAEALFLRGWADELIAENPSRPLAILGDLNDTWESTPVRILCGAAHRPEERCGVELVPVLDTVDEGRRYSTCHGGKKRLIDHILVTESLRGRLQTARILNQGLRDDGSDGPSEHSDHAPVVATFD
jgi:endonuclease/exonuclease/phosphatase family metal-dependent hydrolase